MKTQLLTILAAVLWPFLAVAGTPEKSVHELLQKVRAELPKGWTARYDKEYSWLEVSRDESVLALSAVPNGSPDEKSERWQFRFSFRVLPFVPHLEYQRLSVENEKIQKKAHEIYEALGKRHVDQKFDNFFPKTDEDKQMVAQYEALKKSLHRLPNFYFRDIGLDWLFNSPDNPKIDVLDEGVRDECENVRNIVISLLSKYDATKGK